MTQYNEPNVNELREIKTARSEDAINMAAKNGFFPLIKEVIPSDEVRSGYRVVQDQITGKIEVLGDMRSYRVTDGWDIQDDGDFETVIEWSSYYPYHFESPFAAYLIPADLEVGERVYLLDLIEDIVASTFQGGGSRLKSCEAIWNGKDFEIQYNPEKVTRYVG